MSTHFWQWALRVGVACVALLSLPSIAPAADNDLDGIEDASELSGGVSFGGYTYLPCVGTPAPGAARNACVSPSSKDIFVFLVTAPNGGFLHQNGLINASTLPADVSVLFQFITGPISPVVTTTSSGKVSGLSVGVHVAVVNTFPANRAVGTLGQKAVVMVIDEASEAFAFGRTVQGTPSDTGDVTIWPVYVKNYLNKYIFGGTDTPSVWKAYIQRTASHELSHATALTAHYDSKLGQHHYASGSGTVMDDTVVCNSRRKTCAIYNVYSTGDNPCLLSVMPVTNPLRCGALLNGVVVD